VQELGRSVRQAWDLQSSGVSAAFTPHATDADGPMEHCVEHHFRDLELGSVSTHTQVPVNGTSQSRPNPHGVDSSLERSQGSVGDFA
jgi:hypothetical protein